MTKEKLISVSLPWQVELNQSSLKLEASEDGVSIFLVGDFGKHLTSGESDFLRTQRYSDIKVNFNSFFYSSLRGGDTSINIIDNSKYDWSEVPYYDKLGTGALYYELFNEDWAKTGRCPDTNFYEVIHSKLVHSIKRIRDYAYKHYLILGDEVYVEVIAKSFDWQKQE